MSRSSKQIMRAVPQGGYTVDSKFIAIKMCDGENPLTLAMLEGITVEMVDDAIKLIKKYIPFEMREDFMKKENELSQIKPSIELPNHLREKFGMKNEVITKLIVGMFMFEDIEKATLYVISTFIYHNEMNGKSGEEGEEKEKTGDKCQCCEETYNADQDEELDEQEYGHELSNQEPVISA